MDKGLTNLCHLGITEEQLAAKVIFQIFGDDTPSIQIDPFKLKKIKVYYLSL